MSYGVASCRLVPCRVVLCTRASAAESDARCNESKLDIRMRTSRHVIPLRILFPRPTQFGPIYSQLF